MGFAFVLIKIPVPARPPVTVIAPDATLSFAYEPPPLAREIANAHIPPPACSILVTVNGARLSFVSFNNDIDYILRSSTGRIAVVRDFACFGLEYRGL